MKLLLVKHGEFQKKTGVTVNTDSALSDWGMKQACLTGSWINYNFNLNTFKGYCSPYLKTLQTASVISEITGIDFEVCPALRDYRFDKGKSQIRDGGVHLPNRYIVFQNIKWNPKEWESGTKYFQEENIDDFIDRSTQFLETHQNENLVIVSHVSPIVMLSELSIGKTREDIKKDCLETETFLSKNTNVSTFLSSVERFVFLNGIKNCGVTYIEDGEPQFFGKTVYE